MSRGNHMTMKKFDRETKKRDKASEKAARKQQGWEALAAQRERLRAPLSGEPVEDFEEGLFG